ncbi:MAG: peptidylprolyl isomerase, partial [Clostridiales bacterium]|nr:peptidylprolyl isomerase [Clostridiales bacterium]
IAGEFSDGRTLNVSDVHSAEALENFIENGGTPHLDWQWHNGGYGHTVFGHVVSGMNVVDSIANTPATSADFEDPARRHRPLEDVIIQNISFIIYEEN